MDKSEKINAITKFITSHPESTASLTILKRHLHSNNYFETSEELSGELKNVLNKKSRDEVNFCYYLIK